MYYKLPGLFGGSNKKARENLDAAIAIDPANLSNHLYLGEFLLGTKKKEEARRALQAVLDLPAQADRVGEDKLAKEQAKRLLSEL
jgi:cytochrome c-type biogenesis protein CcmH/NrfG